MRNQRKRIFNEEKEFCKVNFSVVFRIFVNEPRENETSNHRGTEQENTGQKESVWNIPRNCNTHRRRKKKRFFVHISPCVSSLAWSLVSGLWSLVVGPGRWWRRSVRPLLVWSWTPTESVQSSPVPVESVSQSVETIIAVRSGQASSPRFSFSSVVKVCASACSSVRVQSVGPAPTTSQI